MSHLDIIRAWKDPEYRRSLSEAELASLPGHPAGLIELSDTDLDAIAGGLMRLSNFETCTVGAQMCCSGGPAGLTSTPTCPSC